MHLKKHLPRKTNSIVVFRTFFDDTQTDYELAYSITDWQHDFEKGKHLENIFK